MNKKLNYKTWILICLFSLNSSVVSACRAGLMASKNSIFVAKSFDFDVSGGQIFFNPKGLKKQTLLIPSGLNALEWKAQYESLTFSQIGPGFPFGGMNEKGLVVEALWLSSTRTYLDESKPTSNESQYIQYLLDMASDIEQVEMLTQSLQIQKVFAPIHYFVCDRSTHCLTIELIDSEVKITKVVNPKMKVLENSEYADLITQKSNRILQSFQNQISSETELQETHAFDWLNQVSTPNWTRWQFVYDLKKLEVSYRKMGEPASSGGIQKIRLSDFKGQQNILSIDSKGEVTFLSMNQLKHNLNSFNHAFSNFTLLSPIIENFITQKK